MKIKGEAGISATSGVPTYSLIEEDRSVTWTITTKNLEEMDGYDSLDHDGRDRLLAGVLEREIDERVRGPWIREFRREHGTEWLGAHARVARDTLRNYLGLPGGARSLPPKPVA